MFIHLSPHRAYYRVKTHSADESFVSFWYAYVNVVKLFRLLFCVLYTDPSNSVYYRYHSCIQIPDRPCMSLLVILHSLHAREVPWSGSRTILLSSVVIIKQK